MEAAAGCAKPKEIRMAAKVKNVPARASMEPLLTVEDLERLLRVDRHTVRRLWKRGQLPVPIKVGGSHRWRVRDLEPFV
jgi:hypothetical protein